MRSPRLELRSALREWCVWQQRMAVLDQATHQRLAAPPGMRWPADNPADWVEFVPRPESRRVIRAAIEAGVWDPEGAA